MVDKKIFNDALDVDELEKQMEEDDSTAYEDYIESEVKNFLNYFDSAFEVKKETFKEQKDTIHKAIKLVEEHRAYYSAFDLTECETLANVNLEIDEDIEASIFLSIHGMYRPANALLRRWLDTTLSALKFDFELKKCDKNTKTYEELLRKRDDWLKAPGYLRFTGDCSILSTLIDPDTDYIATQLIERKTINSNKLIFIEYIGKLFKDLSKYAHFSGMTPIENLKSVFSKYNKELFKEWFEKFEQVNEICNILILLKFPEMLSLSQIHKELTFPTLKKNQMQKLEKYRKQMKKS